MKVIKPLKLGVLYKTFEYRNRYFWSPAVLVFFDYGTQPHLCTEIDMWKFTADVLGKEAVLDGGMPKERGEVLVSGAFQSPGGKNVPAGRVRLVCGGIDKSLFVFGDRYWKRGKNLAWRMSDPEPMAQKEISYANAFGGSSYPRNPVGKGVAPVDLPGSGTVYPLPNIEYPDQLVVSTQDKSEPACFNPIDLTWPQRFSKGGTYDQTWYNERFPGLADDIDWTFYNTAPEDQQISGFFSGTETFRIEGMHAQEPIIEAKLPGIRPRCFTTKNTEGKTGFEEIDLRMDTVWLFPNALKGVLIYHGLTEVYSDTAMDIDHLVLGYENLDGERRDKLHYHEALTKRLDKEKGFLALLDESDLIPPGELSGFAEMMADEEFLSMKGEGLLQKKQKQQTDAGIAAVRAMIADQGLDPDAAMPLPVEEDDNLEKLDFDKILLDVQAQRKKADSRLEAQLESLGISKDQLIENAKITPAPRPLQSAQQMIAVYAEMGIDRSQIESKMIALEAGMAKTYRQVGHQLPPVIPATAQTDAEKRDLLLNAYTAGETIGAIDFAGVDLSGLDLKGIQLQGGTAGRCRFVQYRFDGSQFKRCFSVARRSVGGQVDFSGFERCGIGACAAGWCTTQQSEPGRGQFGPIRSFPGGSGGCKPDQCRSVGGKGLWK